MRFLSMRVRACAGDVCYRRRRDRRRPARSPTGAEAPLARDRSHRGARRAARLRAVRHLHYEHAGLQPLDVHAAPRRRRRSTRSSPRCASCSSPASSISCSALRVRHRLHAAARAPARRGSGAPCASARARPPVVYVAPARGAARRSASSTRCCSGRATCSSIYAVLGFVLLAIRARCPTAPLLVLLGVCLVLPALADALRPAPLLRCRRRRSRPSSIEQFAGVERRRLRPRDRCATRCARRCASSTGPTPRRSACSPYAVFFVQMATGILIGFLVGRRGWIERLPALRGRLGAGAVDGARARARPRASHRWALGGAALPGGTRAFSARRSRARSAAPR